MKRDFLVKFCFYAARDDLYDVLLMLSQENGVGKATPNFMNRSGVPRRAIAFRDKPYATDLHLRNAFAFR